VAYRLELPCVECHGGSCDGAPASRVGQPRPRARTSHVSHYERKDAAYRAAKKSGLRSRAGIKLEDLDARFHLLCAGQTVVDLGCWPGAWLQVASQRVAAGGRVIGVDLVAVEGLAAENVTVLIGDASDPTVRSALREATGGHADVVLSDMAPKLTGVRATDAAREEALVEIALEVARELLGPRGKLLVKLFSGVEAAMTLRLRREFATVTAFRPASTRKGSSEIYVLACGRNEDRTQ
jgi:23S rRNA (uridine2552-2'-O)-methyltransferase